ncbi:MAG: TraB/GumN family protein, partial [Gammaproteobacteria bacterium]
YQQSVALMAARGVPEPLMQQMKPWAVAVQLNLPQAQSGLFLDMLLYQQASAAGKAVYGLESMEEQMGVFDGMSTAQQIVFLEESIKYVDEVPAMIENITRLYLDRDLGALQAYSDRLMSRGERQLSEALQERLIVERNQRMVGRMQPRLIEGNAFIAVGALHLPGEQGILRLLQNAGYRVKAIY